MRLPAAALNGLETALNRYLALDPVATERLAALHGQVICIEVLGLGLRLYLVPGPSGIQLLSLYEGEPACTLRGTPLGLARVSSTADGTGQLFSGQVEIMGDTELGHRFGNILSSLDIDWEEQLARVSGDVVAHEIGNGARALTRWGRRTLDNLGMDLQEYLQEEVRLLPTRLEVEAFLEDVDTLRDDEQRLQARVARLKDRLAAQRETGPGK